MRKSILYFVIIFFTHTHIDAQSIVTTGGDYFEGTQSTLSWTLGECVTEYVSANNKVLNQGFQQRSQVGPAATSPTNEGFTSSEEITDTNTSIVAYPNPTTGMLTIQAPSETTVQVFNTSGSLLYTRIITEGKNQIDLSALPTGLYFLRVVTHNGDASTIKIIKSN